MIYFNKKDHNMAEIKEASKLANVITKEDFRAYGLKQEENPPVLLEYSSNARFKDMAAKSDMLSVFLKNSGIATRWSTFHSDNYGDSIDYKIYIGLRHDVRQNIKLSCAILRTIIYFIDGKIKLKAGDKIAGLPKFKDSTTYTF